MKFRIALTAFAAALTLTCCGASASTVTMTGDTVTIRYLNPDVNTQLTGNGFPATVTVAPGTSDVVADAFPGGPYFTVNMEPTSIVVTFLQNTLFWPPSAFDGIGIFGIKQKIAGVTQTAAYPNIVSLMGNTVLFNFAGPNVYASGSTVTADLTMSAVPLPAGFVLLGGALVGMGAARRRARA